MTLNEKIFREYDIRGIGDTDLANDVTDGIARSLGGLLKERGIQKISVGRDCRKSSPRIRDCLVKALLDSGISIVDIGIVPTPVLYFSVFHLEVGGGVMITGSHNPGDQNGFKICVGKTTIHGDEIQDLKKRLLAKKFVQGKGNLETVSVNSTYIEHIAKDVRPKMSISIVIDSGNGVGGIVAVDLFKKIGCKVVDLFSEPDGAFPNHHPDPTEPKNLEILVKEVKKQGALLGIGFDGDADRIGVVDRDGRILFGDELLVLYARDILTRHPGATIISEVKASHRLFTDIKEHGGRPILWKTGHSLIKAKMKEENALLAGEMSGHMFFSDRYFGYDDAIYAGARLIEIVAAHGGKSPAELLSDLPDSFSTPEIRVDCADEKKFAVVEEAKKQLQKMGYRVNTVDGARVEFEDGWGLVRASNTQPVLVYRFEANTKDRLDIIRNLFENTVTPLISG